MPIRNYFSYDDLIGNAKSLSRQAHLVEFFKDDRATVEAVTKYVFSGLSSGEGIVVVGTNDHNRAVGLALQALEINTSEAVMTGQLVFLDGEATLESVMDGEMPSREKFFKVIAREIDELSKKFPLVRAYGEMVNMLAGRSNFKAAIALEELWNELAKSRSFSLLCGYSPENLKGGDEAKKLAMVCSCHSHVVRPFPGPGSFAV